MDLNQSILHLVDLNPPSQLTTAIYVLAFAFIVYTGIKTVDHLNSLLMYIKLFVYVLLLVLIFPKVSLERLQGGNWYYLKDSSMLLVTSYGFAIIVPSLREYFNDNIKQLKKVIFIGSLFPLFCYLAWVAAIMGVVPKLGHNGLVELMHNEHSTSGLAHAIDHAVRGTTITNLFRFFSSISMLTAFLGVSLCLFDFLSDGLNLNKKGPQGYFVASLVFIPPLILVLFNPGMYIQAMQYAGILCVILLLLLPALMVYAGRYHLKLSNSKFTTPGGKISVIIILCFSIILFIYGVYTSIT